jgi:hypothetical protein
LHLASLQPILTPKFQLNIIFQVEDFHESSAQNFICILHFPALAAWPAYSHETENKT